MNLKHFLTHDEHYDADGDDDEPGFYFNINVRGGRPEKFFTCAGCGVRRSADEGCAGDDLLSQACDYCVVATWEALARVSRAIAIGERQLWFEPVRTFPDPITAIPVRRSA